MPFLGLSIVRDARPLEKQTDAADYLESNRPRRRTRLMGGIMPAFCLDA
jgi:hypothetical protein